MIDGHSLFAGFHGVCKIFEVRQSKEEVDHWFVALFIETLMLCEATHKLFYLLISETLVFQFLVQDVVKQVDVYIVDCFVLVIVLFLVFFE